MIRAAILLAALTAALGLTGCIDVTCSNQHFDHQPTCHSMLLDCFKAIQACKQIETEAAR